MIIKYEFLTGEVVEVEVADDIGEISVEIDRNIYNSNRRETRRHNSIFTMEEKGHQLKDDSCNIEVDLEEKERTENLKRALEKLLPQQRDLIQKVFYEELSIVEIAKQEGVSEAAIRNRLKKIYKKLKKILI
jgi:RNA polymerase sigma-70 factor (ECF subfamily)